MKALASTKYGRRDVLQLKEVEKPTPKDNEVRIGMYATTATAGDWGVSGLTATEEELHED